jgi:hypothetical protein
MVLHIRQGVTHLFSCAVAHVEVQLLVCSMDMRAAPDLHSVHRDP